MTATLATLRPAPAPATEPRQHLAAAIERHAAAEARVGRIAAAQAKAAELSHAKFLEIEAAEAALAEARDAEPRRLVSELLGDDPDPGPTQADVARELNDAKAAREALAAARETLTAERQAADFSLNLARLARDEAIAAVLQTAPGVAEMLAEFDAAGRRYATLRQALRWLSSQPRDALTPLQRGRLDLHVDSLAADPAAILAQWEPALASLQLDAAAPLPGDDDPNPQEAA